MPKRIQRRRVKGWRMPENCVSVTRPGKWGNPYPPGSLQKFRDVESGQEFEGRIVDVKGSLSFFRQYAVRRAVNSPEWFAPLRGKDLACWCAEGQPCHADILIELANAPESEATNDES